MTPLETLVVGGGASLFLLLIGPNISIEIGGLDIKTLRDDEQVGAGIISSKGCDLLIRSREY